MVVTGNSPLDVLVARRKKLKVVKLESDSLYICEKIPRNTVCCCGSLIPHAEGRKARRADNAVIFTVVFLSNISLSTS